MSHKLPSVTSPPWGNTTKLVVLLITLGTGLLILRRVDGRTWTSLVVAMVLAYLLSPVVTFFERRLRIIKGFEMRRTLSVLLTWLLVLGVVALLIVLIVPATLAQMRQFADDLPDVLDNAEKDLEDALSKPIRIGNFTFVPWTELEKLVKPEEGESTDTSFTTRLQDTLLSMADPALEVVGGAVSLLFTTFFVLIMLFYLMRDGPKFVDYVVEAVPETYQGDVRRLLHELGQVWNAYLRGQVMLCLAVGMATYFAALILGLPQPLVLGMTAGFLEFVPNLGPALAQIPAVLFALTTPSSTIASLDAGLLYAVVVSLTYIGIQQLEAIFLVPRILGHSLNLHPFVVLVAILIGASLMGVLGVILAAPSAATLRLLGRYLRGKLLDEELFPTEAAYASHPGGFVYRLMHYFLEKRFPTLPGSTPAATTDPEDAERPDASGWAV